MAKTAFINSRVDPELKKNAERVFAELGLSMSAALDLFLAQSVLHRGLPFDIKIPNEETQEALKEPLDNLKHYTSTQDMLNDILNESE